ncbi:hypothetical protein T484DRAFT_1948642 [Baffinella frigidus]|nr:hypothetical protein T484DRAFT_1948642 [Cryptophyta sp. CCMP2293]
MAGAAIVHGQMEFPEAMIGGDGAKGRGAMYAFELEAREHFHFSTLGLKPPADPLPRREQEPRPLTATRRSARGPPREVVPDAAWSQQRGREAHVYVGVRNIDDAAHGARARYALDWTGVEVKGKAGKREMDAPPWEKPSIDYRAHAIHGDKRMGWPTQDGLQGAVRGWNGDSVAGLDAVQRHGRPAYGQHWQLRAGDSVGREGYIRAIPRKQRAPPVAPWEKNGQDVPPWENLYPDFKGRTPYLSHHVLHPRR